MKITVCSRDSKLSRMQVEEVAKAMGPHVTFEPIFIKVAGDHDLLSSLRDKDKTDFFTREIDQMQLDGKCRISIHSAKDLPEPLPDGLKMVALTEGVDSGDSLVMREGDRLDTLKSCARIGSSSKRRDQILKTLRPDVHCIEVRGTCVARLQQLENKEIDGLIIAEAALIRLGLTHLNRIPLPGKTAPLQGKLAVLARADDTEMETLFAPLDTRKKKKTSLYLGLDPSHYEGQGELVHCPFIQTIPRQFDSPEICTRISDIPFYTHIIFSSKVGVKVFVECLKHHGYSTSDLQGKEIIAVGKVTTKAAEELGITVTETAIRETQEGIIDLLAKKELDSAYILIPGSALARPLLSNFLMVRRIRHQLCTLYNTELRPPKDLPDMSKIDEIIFTSPSTVDAFQKVFGRFPKNKILTTIGPVTKAKLYLTENQGV